MSTRKSVVKNEESTEDTIKYVSVPEDFFSDDSSFYGDDDTKAMYQDQASSFHPRKYWNVHEAIFEFMIAQNGAQSAQDKVQSVQSKRGIKRKRESTDATSGVFPVMPSNKRSSTSLSSASILTTSPSPAPEPPKEPFNPYADYKTGYQLTETLDEFHARLCPATTPTSTDPWIYIANPYPNRRHTFDDVGGFRQEAYKQVEEYAELKKHIENQNVGKTAGVIARKLKPARDQLESDIFRIAQEKKVTSGKWMLFIPPNEVDDIWRIITKATLRGKLGHAAKVATSDDSDKDRLICVYTEDFSDKTDVERVLLEMKELKLPVNGKDGRGIYYKCDAYTHLNISGGNEYKLKASMYSSREILGEMPQGRRKS